MCAYFTYSNCSCLNFIASPFLASYALNSAYTLVQTLGPKAIYFSSYCFIRSTLWFPWIKTWTQFKIFCLTFNNYLNFYYATCWPCVELRDCSYSSNQSLHRTSRVTFWFTNFYSWATTSPLVRPLCLVLLFLDMLWDTINFLSTFSFLSFSANRAWLFQENPLAYLFLCWPNLTVISQEISYMYFIPFTGNGSPYSHFFSFKAWFKSSLFWDIMTNSIASLSLHHLSLQSSV